MPNSTRRRTAATNDETDPLPGHDPATVFYSRARFREEIAQALYDLMQSYGLNQKEFGELAGKKAKSYMTRVFSGNQNLECDTVSDLFLALGRFPHLVLGVDPNEMRLAKDEGATTTIKESVDGPQEQARIRGETKRFQAEVNSSDKRFPAVGQGKFAKFSTEQFSPDAPIGFGSHMVGSGKFLAPTGR